MSKRTTICENYSLAALTGKVAPCLWATVREGYTVQLWLRAPESDFEFCADERQAKSYMHAQRIALELISA